MSGHDTRSIEQQRKAWIAKLHIAKKDLGWDDDEYRAFLARVTGTVGEAKTSSKDLTLVDWRALRAELERLGWTASKKGAQRRTTPAPDRAALIGKIRAQLAAAGRPEAYADGISKRMFKVDRFEWLPTGRLYAVAAALGVDAGRHGRQI